MGASHQFGAEGGVSSVNNIQGLREAKGWMRPQLAKRMGTSPQQIERLEKSQRKLSLDWIDRAADALGVDPWEVITPDGGPRPKASERAAIDDESIDIRKVDVAYAMGPGTNIDDYPEEGTMRFGLSFLQQLTRAATDKLFAATGDGDSMAPTLINGDTVLIDTSQTKLNMQDRIWAVSVHGAGMIKRLRSVGKGRIQILSDNLIVPLDEVDAQDLHLVGRVIWVGRRV